MVKKFPKRHMQFFHPVTEMLTVSGVGIEISLLLTIFPLHELS